MPAESVALNIEVGSLDETDIDKMREIVSGSGFHPHLYDEGPIGGIINYQPFENTEENRELIKQCVDNIASEFPDAVVDYEFRKNRDAGTVVGKQCFITINSGSPENEKDGSSSGLATDDSIGEQNSIDTNDTIEDSDTPEWRAFDTDSRSDKIRVNAPGADSEREKPPDWRTTNNGNAQNESSLEDREKDRATEAAEHTIYEEIPARKKIRLEYVESADSLEESDREVVEPQGVVESSLYCECGNVFETRESAVDHIREFRS